MNASVLQNENDELEAELAQLQSVLRLSEQLLGMKVKTETKGTKRRWTSTPLPFHLDTDRVFDF